MAEKEQARPLNPSSAWATVIPEPEQATATYQTGTNDVELATLRRSAESLRRRRCVLCCCGWCGATVVALGVVILVLALTVFQVKDPVLTMNSIRVDNFNVDLGTFDHPISVNATLTADISIKNPNAASFQFDNSTTEFYYGGALLGLAYAPDGNVGADRTVRMNVTVDVLGDRVAAQPNATSNVVGGGLNLTSYTDISGRVDLLGIYKHDIDILLTCNMTLTLGLTQQDIKNQVCESTTK